MKKRVKIGVVGVGMVGKEVLRYFKEDVGLCKGEGLFAYDIDPKRPDVKDDVKRADIIFICVPTPSNPDGSCNTDIVESYVAKFADSDKVIVVKSTVPPGTTEKLGEKYKVATLFNPEFLTEKQAQLDFVRPDRQIVGFTERSREYSKIVLDLLPRAPFMSPHVIGTYNFTQLTATEAEVVKYFSNVFGALKVTFANVADIYCEALGANYDNVRLGAASDARIGGSWLDVHHGHYRGFGGYCFPKDTRAVIAVGDELVKKFISHDLRFAKLLENAVAFIRAAYDFNEKLLEYQGLAVEEVSGHIDDERMKEIERKNRG